MYSYKVSVPFWRSIIDTETKTRINNLRFVTHHLKKLVNYLVEKGVDIKAEIYDFSITPTAGLVATHIPYGDTGEYKKAAKFNKIIERTHEDIFIGWDADIVLREVHYDAFYQMLCAFKIAKYYNSFNVRSIDASQSEIDYVNYSTDNFEELKGHMYSTTTLCLGGMYVIPTQYLKEAGGYNEKYTHRGDEDGELHDRLQANLQVIRNPINSFYGYHLPHSYHFFNPLYQKQQ